MSTPVVETASSELGCRVPRERAGDAVWSRLGSFARGAFAVAFVASLSGGCTILFPPETCADLDEVCPDLVCDSYKVNREGCPMCECAEEPDPDPTPVSCHDDSDCAPDELCRFDGFGPQPAPPPDGDEERPGDPPEGGACDPSSPECDPGPMPEPMPEPQGTCVPRECADRDIFLPECPPGTEPVIDFSEDDCGVPQCVPVPGGECEGLSPEECAANPSCEGHFFGGGGGEPDCTVRCDENGNCVEECDADSFCQEICDEAGNCFVECPEDPMPPPPEEFVCLPREPTGGCFSDFDCGPDQICERTVVCGGACREDPSTGEVFCEEFCEEVGFCVETNGCESLPPEECELDPGCELVFSGGAAPCVCEPNGDCACPDPEPSEPICVPRAPSGCQSDVDCGPGSRCELVEICDDGCIAPDPGDGSGAPAPPDCESNCRVEGMCVPDESYTVCSADSECGDGQLCDMINYCELPPGCEDGGDCPAVCLGRCVEPPAPGDLCWSDADCGEGLVCNTWDFCGTPPPDCPDCLIACEGVCTDPNAGNEGLCLADADCAEGQRCATELELCAHPPGSDPNQCWSICVNVEPPPAPGVCLEDADCAEGERCASEVDTCYCPEGQTCDVCYWQCVPLDPDTPAP